jgi:pimeloyl-ACP methyl ester carboxylesterase
MTIQTEAKHGFVQANGLRLHYVEWGDPSAPAIVMLHGLRGSARTWDLVAQPLSSQYRVIALDQRGRGESDWAPDGDYSRDAYIGDLEQAVAQIGLDRFILIGHSMGGANTILFTAKHPEQVSTAVIEDMGPATDPPAPGGARIGREVDATPSKFGSWAEAEAFIRQLRPGATVEAVRTAVENSLKQTSDGSITWKLDLEGIRKARQQNAKQPPFDLWPAVRAIQCPTLVLRGGRSDVFAGETAQAMCEANPRIRWAEIPDASHFVHDDNLEAYNRELGRFLAEVAAPAR